MSAHRHQIPKHTQLPREFNEARKAFVAEWEALTAKGLESDFLEWTDDYEGSHIVPTTHTTVEDGWKFLESDQEFNEKVFKETELRYVNEVAKLRSVLEGRTVLPDLPKLLKRERYVRDIKAGMKIRDKFGGPPFEVKEVLVGHTQIEFVSTTGKTIKRWPNNVEEIQK